MYFAVEPAHPDLPAQIMQRLEALKTQDKPLHVFILVDGAFDETLITARKWKQQPKLSLYADTVLHTLAAAAPHLLTMPDTEQIAWLQRLFEVCAGKPMLSVIASTLPVHALQMHLRPYLVAQTKDGLEWPLRWGDTRTLPALLAAVDDDQRKHLLAPLYGWWSVQRNGELVCWQGDAKPEVSAAEFDKLPLSDSAFSRLVEVAEADAILANIYDTQPDILSAHRPAQCYQRVIQHLDIASNNGIEAASARQHFSVLALCLNEDFSRHPAMTALLQHTQHGANYQDEIAALPSSFWQET